MNWNLAKFHNEVELIELQFIEVQQGLGNDMSFHPGLYIYRILKSLAHDMQKKNKNKEVNSAH